MDPFIVLYDSESWSIEIFQIFQIFQIFTSQLFEILFRNEAEIVTHASNVELISTLEAVVLGKEYIQKQYRFR